MFKRGFTLIELLVVISIIGVLSSFVLSSLQSAREKAQRATALTEMNILRTAIFQMELDTGVLPGGFSSSTTCVANPEIIFTPTTPYCGGGLICNSTSSTDTGTITYNNWDGPYATTEQMYDPWGTRYVFDWDIFCGTGAGQAPLEKCNGYSVISGLMSGGPDKNTGTYVDNEILVFCG